jgi:hypothetical protein
MTGPRSADADIDDVTNALSAVAFPFSAADAIGKIRHLIEHRMHFRHYVLAVNHNGCSFRRAQRDVQYRAVFRNVDLLTPKHRIDSFTQPGFIRKLQEELQRFRP